MGLRESRAIKHVVRLRARAFRNPLLRRLINWACHHLGGFVMQFVGISRLTLGRAVPEVLERPSVTGYEILQDKGTHLC